MQLYSCINPTHNHEKDDVDDVHPVRLQGLIFSFVNRNWICEGKKGEQ